MKIEKKNKVNALSTNKLLYNVRSSNIYQFLTYIKLTKMLKSIGNDTWYQAISKMPMLVSGTSKMSKRDVGSSKNIWNGYITNIYCVYYY